jgi:hypothetical protein
LFFLGVTAVYKVGAISLLEQENTGNFVFFGLKGPEDAAKKPQDCSALF